ncbi:MAG: Crp/Fnr family transcriptional regulator [Nitrospirae bacterium]|nr:MAG: Crp/Fnr family transcriptional regulator [Nitrospirota bacterium]
MLSKTEFAEIFPAFRSGSESLISEMLSSARFQTFPKDMLIYSEGDSCSAIAFILSGEIRVYKTGVSGREITLYEITRGDTCILNASCILSNMSYPANAVSVQEGEMLLFPAADFRRFIEKYEEVRDFVFTLLTKRLTSVMTLVEEVAFGRMDERLLDYLKEKAIEGRLDTTHQNIANDLGTSREVISRLLKDFERKGLVTLSRNFIRLDRT